MKEVTLRIKIGIWVLLTWLVVNVLGATLPLWVSKAFPLYANNQFVSGFFMYAFTFLIVGLYIYMVLLKKLHSREQCIFWISFIALIAVGAGYALFNLNFSIQKFILEKQSLSIIIIYLVCISFGVILHWPDLYSRIDAEFQEKRKLNVENIKKNVQGMRGELEEGGEENE